MNRGHRLGAREVRPGDEPAQAPPPATVPGEQHEMRPALRLPDPPVVLLHHRPMSGQSRPLRAWPSGTSLDRPIRLARRRTHAPAGAPGTRCGDDQPVGVGDHRVEQLDLDADHRMQPHRLGRRHEAHRPVEALVVRDGEPGQPERHRARHQVVGGRRPVEEREVAVRVELGVAGAHASGPDDPSTDRTDVLSFPRNLPRGSCVSGP